MRCKMQSNTTVCHTASRQKIERNIRHSTSHVNVNVMEQSCHTKKIEAAAIE